MAEDYSGLRYTEEDKKQNSVKKFFKNNKKVVLSFAIGAFMGGFFGFDAGTGKKRDNEKIMNAKTHAENQLKPTKDSLETATKYLSDTEAKLLLARDSIQVLTKENEQLVTFLPNAGVATPN